MLLARRFENTRIKKHYQGLGMCQYTSYATTTDTGRILFQRDMEGHTRTSAKLQINDLSECVWIE